MAATVAPVSLEDMAAEIISEIVLLALKGCKRRELFAFCRISRTLRQAALSTSAVWMKLVTTWKVHESSDGSYISRSYLEFLEWWYGRVSKKNGFAMRFTIKFVDGGNRTDWIPLNGRPMEAILTLLSHSRYLETGSAELTHLKHALAQNIQRSPHDSRDTIIPSSTRIPFPSLQSINIKNTYKVGDENRGYEGELQNLLALFETPALQKCVLSNLVLGNPLSIPKYPQDAGGTGEGIGGQLTHICVCFEGTPASWKRFIGGLWSLKSACIKLTLMDPEDTEIRNPSVEGRTIANLSEFLLTIDCRLRVYDVANVLDGLCLPALKTLLIHAPRLTLGCLHRIFGATRVLERIRIHSIFPIVELDANHVGFPTTNDRLINHVPHIRHIMIDVLHIARFRHAFRGYVEGVRNGPWLRGQWKNGPPCVEFYDPGETESMRELMDNLRQSSESPVTPIMGGLGQVDVTFRQRVHKGKEKALEILEDVPCWDLWFDLVEEFQCMGINC